VISGENAEIDRFMKSGLMLRILLFIAAAAGLLWACEDETAEPAGTTGPKVSLRFTPLLSKQVAQDSLAAVNLALTTNRALLAGSQNAAEIQQIQARIAELRQDSLKYTGQLALWSSGNFFIDDLTGPNILEEHHYRDTLVNRNFMLPLDMNRDTSEYYFTYLTRTDTLRLFYQRRLIELLDGTRMELYGLGVDQGATSFDSAAITCEQASCKHYEVAIDLYF
jgi:hypothetical protein